MNKREFKKKLGKIIPELVYNSSLLDSESIEIPIYFYVDEKGNVKIDYEDMQKEFNNKLNQILELVKWIIKN